MDENLLLRFLRGHSRGVKLVIAEVLFYDILETFLFQNHNMYCHVNKFKLAITYFLSYNNSNIFKYEKHMSKDDVSHKPLVDILARARKGRFKRVSEKPNAMRSLREVELKHNWCWQFL